MLCLNKMTLATLCGFALLSGCDADTSQETSVTLVGKVVTSQDSFEEDDNGNTVTVHYVTVQPESLNSTCETFTIDDNLPTEAGKRYGFRVWNSEPNRHVSEAIPIPN